MYYVASYNNDYGLCISQVDNKAKTWSDKFPKGTVGFPFMRKLSTYQFRNLMSGSTIIVSKNNNIIKQLF